MSEESGVRHINSRTSQTSYAFSGMQRVCECVFLLFSRCYFESGRVDAGIWYHRHHRIVNRVGKCALRNVRCSHVESLLRRIGAYVACAAVSTHKKSVSQHGTNENVFPNTKLLFSKLLVLTKHPTETGYCVASFRHCVCCTFLTFSEDFYFVLVVVCRCVVDSHSHLYSPYLIRAGCMRCVHSIRCFFFLV